MAAENLSGLNIPELEKKSAKAVDVFAKGSARYERVGLAFGKGDWDTDIAIANRRARINTLVTRVARRREETQSVLEPRKEQAISQARLFDAQAQDLAAKLLQLEALSAHIPPAILERRRAEVEAFRNSATTDPDLAYGLAQLRPVQTPEPTILIVDEAPILPIIEPAKLDHKVRFQKFPVTIGDSTFEVTGNISAAVLAFVDRALEGETITICQIVTEVYGVPNPRGTQVINVREIFKRHAALLAENGFDVALELPAGKLKTPGLDVIRVTRTDTEASTENVKPNFPGNHLAIMAQLILQRQGVVYLDQSGEPRLTFDLFTDRQPEDEQKIRNSVKTENDKRIRALAPELKAQLQDTVLVEISALLASPEQLDEFLNQPNDGNGTEALQLIMYLLATENTPVIDMLRLPILVQKATLHRQAVRYSILPKELADKLPARSVNIDIDESAVPLSPAEGTDIPASPDSDTRKKPSLNVTDIRKNTLEFQNAVSMVIQELRRHNFIDSDVISFNQLTRAVPFATARYQEMLIEQGFTSAVRDERGNPATNPVNMAIILLLHSNPDLKNIPATFKKRLTEVVKLMVAEHREDSK